MRVVLGMIGYLCSVYDVKIPLFIDTALTAMPFYAFGYFIKNYTSLLYPNKYDKFNLALFVLFLVFCFVFSKPVNFMSNSYSEGNIVTFFLCGVLGTMGVLLLSKALNSLPIITTFGRYSIIVLVTHYPILGFLFAVFDRLGLPVWIEIILIYITVMTMMLGIIPIMKKYFGYITAPKDIIKIKKNDPKEILYLRHPILPFS